MTSLKQRLTRWLPGATLAVALLAPLTPGHTQVVVSEFCASNGSTLPDETGQYPDWIELFNTSAATVNLEGWFLTDDSDTRTLWRFPAVSIPGRGYLVVFASGSNRTNPPANLHTSFSLDADGDYLALVEPDGQSIASEFAPEFPPQQRNISFGYAQSASGDIQPGARYFSTPTPGSLNGTGFVAFVADTRFTVDRGFFTAPFDVEIATTTPDANVYYTTNGTPPSPTNGSLYVTPLRVAGTTTLRAAAFKTGYRPSNIDTHTYLFTGDIIRQSPAGTAPPGWPATWGANVVDYGMDPDVVDNPEWRDTLQDDLKAIPTFSVVLDLKLLFDPTTGIYANPGQDGILWERPCSLELIHPTRAAQGFQVNAGIRIRGGFSRSTANPKHAFRFFFREEYGATKLRHPLFGDGGADSFDAIDLRTFQNYSWSFQGDSQGVFLRDQVNRDLQLALGHQAERGDYYHLYINGQYWGLYNTCERPEASYGATYFGGIPENFDVIKVEAGIYEINATDGNMNAWTRLYNLAKAGLASDAACEFVLGNNPDGTRNPAYERLVDADNLIDYMLVIFFGGNLDAPISNFLQNQSPNNWFGLRDRTGPDGFRFFVHDAEHTLLNVNENRTGPFAAGDTSVLKSNPQWIWQKLVANPEFRLRTADRIHGAFFNRGPLTPEGASALFQTRQTQIDRAVVAESARWGDSKRDPPLTRNHWLAAINNIHTGYLPQRPAVVLNQLRAQGIYPPLAAPSFNQHGGSIPAGFSLAMSAPGGTVHYTLGGQDPRLRGGAISQAALAYSAPVPLTRSTLVKARTRDISGNWSALNEAAFTLIQTWRNLLITEIMYHPANEADVDGDEFEFIELKNVGPTTLDLSGITFTNGIRYSFPLGAQLDPDRFLILVANPAAFTSRYPGVAYDGVYAGRLNNAGETITLVHAAGAPIFSVTYGDAPPWPQSADGIGFSIVPVNANANPTPDDPAQWRPSSAVAGSPGSDDPAANVAPIWITEVLTHTDPPQLDSIELFNPNPAPAAIGGWFLTDDRTQPRKFRIPNDTTLVGGARRVFTELEFNPNPGTSTSFNLSSYGEETFLYSADNAGNLTGFSDGFAFPAAANGVSFGRHLISTGEAQYPPQWSLSLGTTNSGPRVGPVVVNEIQFHPAPGELEFVELRNITPTNVPLFDPDYPSHTWKLQGIDFTFPTNVTLPPNGFLVLSEGHPDSFRSRHSIPALVPVLGPFSGFLQNDGESLRLQRPDHPDLLTNNVLFVPYIDVDVVRYDNRAPWPAGADGTGSSLERVLSTGYGNDPINWRMSPGEPSAGFDNDGNRRPQVTAGPDQQFVASTFPVTLNLAGYATDDAEPSPPAILTTTWSQAGGPGPIAFANPGATNTTARFPGVGTYQIRLDASDSQFTSTDTLVVTLTRTVQTISLVPPRSAWKFFDQGTLPAANWKAPDYIDTAWMSGTAPLGYNDAHIVTPISYGPNASSKFITTYFRREFNVVAASAVQSLTLSLLRDDGAIVYLNGVRVAGSNMPEGFIGNSTPATSAIGNADETTYFTFPADPAVLAEGRNVLAVELHQSSGSSSDLGFDLGLSAESFPPNAAPQVTAGPDQAVDLASGALLAGSVSDDGLPIPPGLLVANWSKLAGPGTVSFTPSTSTHSRASFGAPGSYLLRLAASDGLLSSSSALTVAVTGESFESWRTRLFTTADLNNPAISGPDADPDGDGHTNQQEYLAGTLPKDAASVLRFESVEATLDPARTVTLRFHTATGKSYSLQYRETAHSGPWLKLQDLPPASADQLQTLTYPVPAATRYYRVVTPAAD